MAESDGSVIIKVRLDTSNVQQGVGNIKAGCKRAADTVADMGRSMSTAMDAALSSVSTGGATDAVVSDAKQAAGEIVDVLERACKEAESVMESSGINGTFEEAVHADIQALDALVDDMQSRGLVTDEFMARLTQRLEYFRGMKDQAMAAGMGPGTQVYDYAAAAIERLLEVQKEYNTEVQKMDTAPWERFKSALSGVAKRILGVADASTKAEKKTNKLKNSLSGGLKTILRYGVGLKAASTLLSALSSGIRDGMEILAKSDTKTADTLNGLKNSLNQVKASLATAFAPVLTAVAPLLSKLCSMLVTAANYVAMFFAALGGKKTYLGVSGTAASSGAANISAPGAGVRIASLGQDGPAADYAPAAARPMAATAGAVGRAAAQTGRVDTAPSAAVYTEISAAIDAATASAERFERTATDSYAAVGRAIDAATDKAAGTARAISATGDAAEETAGSVTDIGKAAKEAERNLSGLDEMNIWKAKDETAGGGGGGGGGGGLDVSGSDIGFAEMPVDTEALSGIVDNMDDILAAVEAVGAGLLTWKVARGFGASLKTAAGLAMDVAGAVLLAKGNADAWANGPSWGSLTKQLSGTALLAGGLALQFGKFGGALGGLVGGISMVVTGTRDWIKLGYATNETLATISSGLGAIGITLSIMSGSWIPMLAVAVVDAAVIAIGKMDEVHAALKEWEKSLVPGRMDVDEAITAYGEAAASGVDNATNVFLDSLVRNGSLSQTEANKIAQDTGREYVSGLKYVEPEAGEAGGKLVEAVPDGMSATMNQYITELKSNGEFSARCYLDGLIVGEELSEAEAARIALAASDTLKADGEYGFANAAELAAMAYIEQIRAKSPDGWEESKSFGQSAVDGVSEGVDAMSETVDTKLGKMNQSVIDKKLRRTGEITKNRFGEVRSAASDEVSGMATDVSSGYDTMAGTVGDESSGMNTDSDTAWKAMKILLVSMADLMKDKVVSVYNSMGKKVSTIMSQASDDSSASWTAMEMSERTALERMLQTSSDLVSKLRITITTTFERLKSDAYNWGSDLGSLFAAGMRSKMSSVSSAASSVASAARSYLHFSVPDKGPLADADEYGGDFMALLADKMLQNKDVPAKAAFIVAQRMQDVFDRLGQTYRAPVLASGTVIPPRAAYVGGQVSGLEDMGAQVRKLLDHLTGGGEKGEATYKFTANLDGRQIFNAVIREGKLRQSQTGRNPFDL